ncbi:hypothetical protein C7459_11022 [Tumebacillus permanentifrigoris]|uniref:Uncharacterized protein n=1 Tax=Tumebacillus permanentifrigoris TaxID=378543 RepID=A0A316DTZ9_9BACL|nr:hypothetical protein C7459_11022 [Tumebacillus permanentifrigoris]
MSVEQLRNLATEEEIQFEEIDVVEANNSKYAAA